MGRPVGSTALSVKEMKKIVRLTVEESLNRPEIAEQVDVSERTVYKYQKEFGLV